MHRVSQNLTDFFIQISWWHAQTLHRFALMEFIDGLEVACDVDMLLAGDYPYVKFFPLGSKYIKFAY